MKLSVLFASAVLVMTATAVQADPAADQALAAKNGCLACHSVDKKVVGPAYKDVAAKYKGKKGAAAMLAAKVKKGGSGVWGPVPMPPNPNVNDKDLQKIVAWILAQK
jgi:cytochrome c